MLLIVWVGVMACVIIAVLLGMVIERLGEINDDLVKANDLKRRMYR